MDESHHNLTIGELGQIPLFRHVQPESAQGVLDRCRSVTLTRHEVLMRQGELNRNLYVVLAGELSVRLDSLDSDPIVVLGVGETIGEMSLIDHKGASAYVVAASDCRLLTLDEETLWSLVRASHAAACNLLEIMTGRLRNANMVLSERMRLEYDFHQYGTVDALTGLHNRYWLDRVLPRLTRRHTRNGMPMSLIMSDIDFFKDFNTRYGHLCGDHVIHAVAQVFTEHLRPSEMAARYGGDEFVVLLPGVPIEQARKAGERLQRMVAGSVVHGPAGVAIPTPTISLGIAQYRPGDTAEQFVAAADAAMYRAKDQGRDVVAE